MAKITLVITDDHRMLRETWAFLLNNDPGFDVIALAGTGEEAITLVQQFHPDIVLMDINLPGIGGIEATEVIRSVSPATKVIGVSMHIQPSYAYKMIEYGASGYVTKSSSIKEMCEAIVEVHHDRRYICQAVKDALCHLTISGNVEKPSLHAMSKRKLEIIEFVRKGYSSREIAGHLKLTLKTIEAHRYQILKKLNLRNSAALVNYINNSQPVIYG